MKRSSVRLTRPNSSPTSFLLPPGLEVVRRGREGLSERGSN